MSGAFGAHRWWPWVVLSVLAVDQVSKQLAERFLGLWQPLPVLPVVSLTLGYNTGAAFSFLGTAGGWQRALFVAVGVVASVVIVIWLRRLPGDERWSCWALSLILGGALGNLIDRLVHGHVIDFIHLHYDRWHYPVFNIADSAITVGVVMVLIHVVWLERRRA